MIVIANSRMRNRMKTASYSDAKPAGDSDLMPATLGIVYVFERRGTGYIRSGRVPTASGVRTSLLVPKMDRVFVAVDAAAGESTAVWTFRTIP